MTTVKINVVTKEIEVTKAFVKKASVIGSKEFSEMADLIRSYPNFTITTTKSNTTKQTHSRLTVARMDFCVRELTNDNQEQIEEFDKVKSYFKGTHSYYTKVKQYFLAKYPNYNDVPFVDESTQSATEMSEKKITGAGREIRGSAVKLPKTA